MLRTALKSAFSHKLRLALTAMSVMMSVAFIAGTFIFTDTINATFDDLFGDVYAGTDVIVQSATEFDVGYTGPPPVDEAVLETILAVPGVETAGGDVSGFAVISDKDGDAIMPMGAPTLGGSWIEDDRLAGNSELRAGRAPVGAHEVVIDAHTVDSNGFAVGDTITVQTPNLVADYELVGVMGFGDADNLAGTTYTVFDLVTAQTLFDMEGQLSSISVLGTEDVSPEVLRDRIAMAVPADLAVSTSEDEAAAQSESIKEGLGFLTTALLVFAAVAVFVAAFIIQNTFRIIVRQRQRELALMRAVGATGRQVIWLVVIEAILVAVFASVVGIALGFLIAQGLTAVMAAIGLDMPSTSAPLASRTIIVGLTVGLVVTVAAAVLPAIRASRIPPVAALREMDVSLRMSDKARAIAGGILMVVGLGLILNGLFGDVLDFGPLNELTAIGVGAVMVFLAVSLLSSNIIKPAASFLGKRPVLAVLGAIAGLVLAGAGAGLLVLGAAGGVIGLILTLVPAVAVLAIGALALYLAWTVLRDRFTPALATQNSVRKPRRTATTASALMIGLALVTFFFVLGDSIKASAGQAIEQGLRADYVVSVDSFVGGISPALGESLDGQPEIAATTSLRFGFWDNDGTEDFVMGIDAETADETIFLDIKSGSLEALAAGGVFVHDDAAADNGWVVGDRVPMGFASTGLQQVEIVGTYGEQNVVQSAYLVGLDFFGANFSGFGSDLDYVLAIKAADGVPADTARAVVEAAAADYTNATVRDQAEYRASQEEQVDAILVMFNALLALAVIIAIFGIANTLALSIFERTHEIGLLRAVGMSRGQVVRTVSWESMMVAIIGAVLGILVGLLFGVVVTSALSAQGIDVLSIPAVQIVALVVFGAIAGLVAAVFPARRASRLNILEAIAFE